MIEEGERNKDIQRERYAENEVGQREQCTKEKKEQRTNKEVKKGNGRN